MGLINFQYARLKIKDGTGTPNEFEVSFGEGTFQYSEQRPREYIKERGRVVSGQVRDADEEPVEVNIDAIWTEMRAVSGGPVTLEEALKKVGAAAAWVSTGSTCEPYSVDLVFEYGADCSGTTGHRLTFDDFRYEKLDYDGKANTVKVSGKCKCVSPTIIRTAVS